MLFPCDICEHAQRLDIDMDLVSGKSHYRISKEYFVNPRALRWHMEHLPRRLVQAQAKQILAESMDLLGRIEQSIARAERIFQRNYEKNTTAGDHAALQALREKRSYLELLGTSNAFVYEVRLRELQKSQERFDQERDAEIDAQLRRLTFEEREMLLQLQFKMAGDTDELLNMFKPPDKEFAPQKPEPAPEPTPVPPVKPAQEPVSPAPEPEAKPAPKTEPYFKTVRIPG
jgi:hypothetical protein